MSSSCFNFRTFEGQHSGAIGVCSEFHDRNLQQNFRCQRQIWITQTKAIFLMKWHILYPRIILYTNVLLIRFPWGLWEVLIFNHSITCFLFWKFYKRTENTKLLKNQNFTFWISHHNSDGGSIVSCFEWLFICNVIILKLQELFVLTWYSIWYG